jgi:GT2 family glycosyltransferase
VEAYSHQLPSPLAGACSASPLGDLPGPSPRPLKKLSVIIVNYNVCYFLEQALLSVRKAAGGLDVEVLVVDNNSVDGSVEMVRRRFPEVTLLVNPRNLGFSKANNQAIREAKGEYVLLLNPDTVVEEDAFARCCFFMDQHPEAGALGVKMLDGKGGFLPESKRGLPTPEVAFYKVFGLAALFPRSRRFGRYHLGFLDQDQVQEVEVLSGAFMFIRRSALERVGLLDEDYFMYGEDIDLSYRILQGGFKNYYYPHTRIIHYKGESTKKSSVNYVVVFYKAMAIFARKHFSSNRAGLFSLLIHLAIFLRAGLALLFRLARRVWPAMLDAILLFGGMYLLKSYWETYQKPEPGNYPPEFLTVAIPVYLLVWLTSAYFSGGYDPPFKTHRLVRGVVVGTVLISAVSNFLEAYRFSKALILLGGAWSVVAMVGWRLGVHALKHRNLQLGQARPKRIATVGSTGESQRVLHLLRQAGVRATVVGYVSPDSAAEASPDRLGRVAQLNEIIRLYGLNELIFCGKDLGAAQIIKLMVEVNDRTVEYKILPEESQYIIGSSSKNTPGDYYGLPLQLNLYQKAQVRNKRLLDVLLSGSFLVLSPVLVWLVQEKAGFFRNCLQVLGQQKTWVGLRFTPTQGQVERKPILSAADRYEGQTLDDPTRLQLEVQYANDYSPYADLKIIFSCLPLLGRTA